MTDVVMAVDAGGTKPLGLLDELARLADDDGQVVRAAGIGFPEYVRDERLTSDEVYDWRVQPTDACTGTMGR